MSILILGGTSWLGGQLALAGMAAGHDVTCLARGESGIVPQGAELVRADRDRPHAYAGLEGAGPWDLVVDVTRQPGHGKWALEALSDRAERWAFVSSGSVYADHSKHGGTESDPLLPPYEGDLAEAEQYGEAKSAIEKACLEARGDNVLIARSGLIAGKGDRSDRVGYWPGRFALAAKDDGPVLVPAVTDRPVQFLDVDDLAGWIIDAGLRGVTGPLDAYGPQTTLGEVLAVAQRLAGFEGPLESATDEQLVAATVEEYMGPRSLPLWLHDPEWAGFQARTGEAARAAGLTARPIEDTLAAALQWERELGLDRETRRAGLSRADELEIIAALS